MTVLWGGVMPTSAQLRTAKDARTMFRDALSRFLKWDCHAIGTFFPILPIIYFGKRLLSFTQLTRCWRRHAFCNPRCYWESEMQNAFLICLTWAWPNVRQFGGDVDAVVPDILTVTTFPNQNERFSVWFWRSVSSCIFAIFSVAQTDLALSPYFFDFAYFDRILNWTNNRGRCGKLFENLFKTVPLWPRFFSY